MSFEMANLFVLLIMLAVPVIVAFLVIYWAVRLAIRHERDPRNR
jgi:steroid 5-alpha reductase family enzyme